MIACVVLCYVMHCDVMVMSCYLFCPCKRMECYELKMPLVVRLRRVVQNIMIWRFKNLLSISEYYSIITLYYKILQRTSPILLCTTKYYSNTTLYYKNYYSNTTPILQITTLHYFVLQRTTPVLLCTTPVLQHIIPIRLSATIYYSSTILYYKVLLRYYFEMSFILAGTTRVTLQFHEILRLPPKMKLIID